MKESEFDKFAEEYRQMHEKNIEASGEAPEFFAEYKVRDAAAEIRKKQFADDLRLLDFGSGIGNSIPFFRRYMPRIQLTCLDVSKRSLEVAEDRFGAPTEYTRFDGFHIPYPESHFSVGFSACVFHHINHHDHLHLFGEIRRVLRPGGLMLIFEHNPKNPLTVHAVNTCPFDVNAKLLPAGELRKTIVAAGFESVDVRYRVFFPHWLRAMRQSERFLTRIPFGAQYYVSACKPA